MFRQPVYFAWLLPALALLGLAFFRGARKRRQIADELGWARTLARLAPAEAAGRRRLKTGLEAGALALLFLALAGPQWGVELLDTEASTRQVLLAVDTSLSMSAEDIKPSRLEKAKSELSLLLENLKGNRVGIIAFAGEAALACPLTLDLEAAKQLLRDLEPGMIPVPGSAIGKAVRLATALLSRYPGGKSLVLLTDGEDHRSDPLGAAEEAAAAGIKVFAIGIGTPEGEPLPLKDSSGGLTGYKKDRRGQTVISRLGESALSELASRTGGAYFRASPSEEEAAQILRAILETDEAKAVRGTVQQYKNRFLFPLALAFLLLFIDFLLPERSGRRAPVLALALLLLAGPRQALAATAEGSLRRGNELYRQEQYAPSLEEYARAGKKRPQDPRPVFNAGDALYRLSEYEAAAVSFRRIAQSQAPTALRADAYYNLGNSRFQAGQYREAVESYRQAIRLNPGDAEARHNLAVALRHLKNPPPPDKNPQKKPPEKPQGKEKEGGGSSAEPPPSQPRTRPQDEISREDAERILRAVSEKEKALQRAVQKLSPRQKTPPTEEDW